MKSLGSSKFLEFPRIFRETIEPGKISRVQQRGKRSETNIGSVTSACMSVGSGPSSASTILTPKAMLSKVGKGSKTAARWYTGAGRSDGLHFPAEHGN